MRNNLSREGGKKLFPVFWQRIFLQELQNGHKGIRGFTLLDNYNYSSLLYEDIWYLWTSP